MKERDEYSGFDCSLVMDRRTAFLRIIETLEEESEISSAKIYGSSLLRWEGTPDVDIAIMVNSVGGVIETEVYKRLRKIRKDLCEMTGCDVDLVPHTEDEVDYPNSPLHNARYYPSLVNGIDIKGSFPLPEKVNLLQDTAAYVLEDNRTVTRRQLLRENGQSNWRIFISKLIHGPGNAVNYLYFHKRFPLMVNPSDLDQCFKAYDEVFLIDSQEIRRRLEDGSGKVKDGTFEFEEGLYILNWYELLVRKVLYGN